MNSESLHRFCLDDIILEERIGCGNYSVYKATTAGKLMAVKRIDVNKYEIPREVKVHSSLPPHPNILPFFGIAHSKDGFSVYICMELGDKSLYKYLHEEKQKPALQRSTKWAVQLARGMHHLHKHEIAHRDLKSANILLFEKEDVIKVCDFGSARPLEYSATLSQTAGTYRWMAPEFNDKASTKVNQRCDLFSYGMVLYEIFVHKVPFSDLDQAVDVLTSIHDGKRPSIPLELPLYIRELMQSCWKHNPYDRPSFEEIIQDGWTLLHRAAESGDDSAVRQLINVHVNVNSQTAKDGLTALHLASEHGHVNVVHVLIRAHADLNLKDKGGRTALYFASKQGHVTIVQLLLEAYADITICRKGGFGPLYMASWYGHTEIVDALLMSGADPNKACLTSPHPVPLEIAAEEGHVQTVQRLLEGGANINYQQESGQTALYNASWNGHLAVVCLLLQKYADVSICDMNGWTPLMAASFNGRANVVRVLIEAHADINQQNKDGVTALFFSCQNRHQDVVQLLLQSGARDLPTKAGETAIHISRDQGDTAMVHLLQQYAHSY